LLIPKKPAERRADLSMLVNKWHAESRQTDRANAGHAEGD
jgi:hypothetical protein